MIFRIIITLVIGVGLVLGVGIYMVSQPDIAQETPPYIGIRFVPMNPVGVKVHEVFVDSPADIAGIKPDDIILAVDDQYIDAVSFIELLPDHIPYETITLNIQRNGQQQDIALQLMPSPIEDNSVDMVMMNMNGMRDGVVLSGVRYDSSTWHIDTISQTLADAGLRRGDVIVGINGHTLETSEITTLRLTMLFEESAVLHIQRENNLVKITVPASVALRLLINETH